MFRRLSSLIGIVLTSALGGCLPMAGPHTSWEDVQELCHWMTDAEIRLTTGRVQDLRDEGVTYSESYGMVAHLGRTGEYDPPVVGCLLGVVNYVYGK